MRIIAGEARSRTILAPEGRDTRPTLDRVRENLFNILQWQCPGARVLDLFAGSGALALEALSRGAAKLCWRIATPGLCGWSARTWKPGLFTARPGASGGLAGDGAQIIRGRPELSAGIFGPAYAMEDLTAVFEALRTGGVIDADSLVIVEHQLGIHPRWGKAS